MNLIAFLLRSSGRLMAIAILTGFFSGASSAGLIALISWSLASNPLTAGRTLAIGFLGLVGIVLLTDMTARMSLIRLSQEAVFRLQLRLSRQILASELSHLEQLGASRLLATLTEDVLTISNAVFILPFLFINLAIVAGCFVYITWLSWQVLLIILGLFALAMGSCQVFLRRGRRMLALAREERDRLFQHFQTITDGVKELKLHYWRRQDFLQQDLRVTADQFRRYNTIGLSLYAVNESIGKFLFFFAIGLVLFFIPHIIAIDTRTLAGYVLTFTYLIGPMDNIVSKLPILSKADIALQNIDALGLLLNNRAEATVVPKAIDPVWKSLELTGVTHTYLSGQDETYFTLGPIDLTLKPGELVFIVGGNGSGKSTLAKLITGLYVPETGEICLNQQPITAENREWYRQHFSVVFADFHLFEQLLGFNNPELDRQAQAYLHLLQLDRKVTVESGKLSTTALSQGQRKRLALLTSYLEDRPIYLFDEWAADQDPVFKQLFYTQLLPQLRDRGKTVLVITHDDHYFHLADRMIKLNYGQIEFDHVQSHP
ncbi:cyclic peptide export ABC transporter [Pantanalinema sp. GBBB05]|uniref:cyclic peptide export ABC transporter n=1 Tax=Pantanalinema sp. GBBB05 TaxID=2604139 RepID=UPI001DB7DEAF|nr:cyclic peptide export ABC transporter [Pantanalinema sp. GBBB05]